MAMYGSNRKDATDAEAERTAFRKTEKRYKLYKSPLPNGEDIPSGIYPFQCAAGFSHPVFCFHSHPGFYFIPEALNIEEQCLWIKESLTSFPQPPNRTNHTAIYGHLHDLFSAVESEKILTEKSVGDEDEKSIRCEKLQDCRYIFSEKASYKEDRGPFRKKVIPASVLLRKLRWSTLGLQFDWSKVILIDDVF